MLCVYLAYSIVDLQIERYKRRQAIEETKRQISELQMESDDIKHILSGGEEDYIERVAREKLGYAAPGDRVFEAA
jgi:cell division protein DivIC